MFNPETDSNGPFGKVAEHKVNSVSYQGVLNTSNQMYNVIRVMKICQGNENIWEREWITHKSNPNQTPQFVNHIDVSTLL